MEGDFEGEAAALARYVGIGFRVLGIVETCETAGRVEMVFEPHPLVPDFDMTHFARVKKALLEERQ